MPVFLNLHSLLMKNTVTTFADRVIQFNSELYCSEVLPAGIKIMNPFLENESAITSSKRFYKKYYNDNMTRHLILGINPGRFGSAVTGVAFTDTHRLRSECGIHYPDKDTYEPSSAFIYEMIKAFGGPASFYEKFYINSVCPLGFTKTNTRGKDINYNYYDDPALTIKMYPFILESIERQLQFGIHSNICFCFGTGKNAAWLQKINAVHKFFAEIVPLEHPRYIMQYKSTQRRYYIDKYLAAFKKTEI